MILKIRLSNKTRKNINEFKKQLFEEEDRVKNGFLIGSAIDKYAETEKNIWDHAKENIWKKKQRDVKVDEAVPTSISIRQDQQEKLLTLQKKLEQFYNEKYHMSQVVEILMERAIINENNVQLSFEDKYSAITTDITEKKDKSKNAIMRIMEHYSLLGGIEVEDEKEADWIFKKLGWNENKRDIINSFWSVYTTYLAIYDPFSERHLYKFDHDGSVVMDTAAIQNEPYYQHIVKKYHANEYINPPVSGKRWNDKRKLQKIVKDNRLLEKLAYVSHEPASFTDCPEGFNRAKGLIQGIYDMLPLFVDKIQKGIDEGKEIKYIEDGQVIKITPEMLKSWQQWLVQHRSDRMLDEYYYIINKENKKKIIGIPIFKKQTLEYALPKNEDEWLEYINNIFRITKTRALRMAWEIYSKSTVDVRVDMGK